MYWKAKNTQITKYLSYPIRSDECIGNENISLRSINILIIFGIRSNFLRNGRSGLMYLSIGREMKVSVIIKPLNAEINPICHFLAPEEDHHFFDESRIRVKKTYQFSIWVKDIINHPAVNFNATCRKLRTIKEIKKLD